MTPNFHRKQIAQILGAALLAPLLFLAAGGPLLRCSLQYPAMARATSAIYDPVFRLFDVTPLEQPWLKYLNWWGVEALDVGDNRTQHAFLVPLR